MSENIGTYGIGTQDHKRWYKHIEDLKVTSTTKQ